jgi:hypothetical protein
MFDVSIAVKLHFPLKGNSTYGQAQKFKLRHYRKIVGVGDS